MTELMLHEEVLILALDDEKGTSTMSWNPIISSLRLLRRVCVD
jgi:hypothetical protein